MINLNCGVYQIRNIATGLCLAGQSMRLKQRPGEHWRKLKNNKHRNRYLQRSYNKRGREFFVFEILLYCEDFELTRYEQFFVDKYVKLNIAYNICKECVDSNKGVKRSEETKEKISFAAHNISDETRERLCEANRGKNNPNYGKHHSLETLEKMSEKQKGKNNPMWGVCGKDNHKTTKEDVVLTIISLMENGFTIKEIVKNLNISSNVVSKVRCGYYNKIYGLMPREWDKTILKGEKHWRITKKEVVLKIIDMLDNNFMQKDIMKKLNVSHQTIVRARDGWYDDIYNLKN